MEAQNDTQLVKPPSAIGAWVRRNPIALKELRGRMRGARAFVVLTVYLVLMSIFTVILYMIYTTSNNALSTTGGVVGKMVFGGVLAIELFMVCFIAPAFTTGAISGEKERQTFDLLRTTLLPARRIVVGKLMAALAYIVLLLVVAVPLQSLAFLMGGVTVEEVLLSVELLFITSIGYGAMGILLSAATKRTLGASVITYVIALLMTVALPLLLLFFGLFLFNTGINNQPGLEAVLTYIFGLLVSTNPISTVVVTENVLQQHGSVFFFQQALSNGSKIPLISPWISYTVIYLILAMVFISRSVQLVRKVGRE
jgi:ABC-2 type transport system permease protein